MAATPRLNTIIRALESGEIAVTLRRRTTPFRRAAIRARNPQIPTSRRASAATLRLSLRGTGA